LQYKGAPILVGSIKMDRPAAPFARWFPDSNWVATALAPATPSDTWLQACSACKPISRKAKNTQQWVGDQIDLN